MSSTDLTVVSFALVADTLNMFIVLYSRQGNTTQVLDSREYRSYLKKPFIRKAVAENKDPFTNS